MSGISTRSRWFLGMAMGGAIALSANCALAQIKPVLDNTLGAESSIVTPNVAINGIPSDRIDGGAIRGRNLFHSFQEFNIDSGRGAYFTNPAGIENIFSRVTGSNASKILGTLGVLGNANLFLINPNGIIFGPSSSLDIRGSFVASTAIRLVFADGTQFSTTKPQTAPLLTVSVPIGLQFGTSPSGIQVQDVNLLDVQPGVTRALVGGDVVLDDSGLRARGGRVELGGLAEAGTVNLAVNNNDISLNFPATAARANVSLKNGSVVRVDSVGGGSIAINASNFNLTQDSQLRAGIRDVGTADSQAGDIVVKATGEVTLAGADSYISNAVLSNTIGNAGNIYLTSQSLKVIDGAQIYTATRAQGNAGNVNIDVDGRALFSGINGGRISGAFSRVEEGSIGQGGSVNIKAGTLDVLGGAELVANTAGFGRAGNVNITAQNISFDGKGSSNPNIGLSGAYSEVEKSGTGQGGSINIIGADSLSVTNGARLEANTFGNGDAGSITINARKTVSFDGTFPSDAARKEQSDIYSSGAFSRVDRNEDGTIGIGKSGSISITTGTLSVANGAVLTTSTFGQQGAGIIDIKATDAVSFIGEGANFLSSGAYSRILEGGAGQGGSINITTGTLSVTNGAVITTSTAGQGNAGGINIDAHSVILKGVGPDLADRGLFSAVKEGASGQGGNIKVNTDSLFATDGALIAASTLGNGNGGSIQVHASENVTIKDKAEISVSSLGSGVAGNIKATADSIFLTDQGAITAETQSTNGGNIMLGMQKLLLLRHSSQISTTAGTEQAGGNGGKIIINAPDGFIIAVPRENSDIRANAYKGKGGNVQITASGIYGTQFRPQDTLLSDITASSTFGVNGTVQINTPDVDPSRGLVNLPVQPIDTKVSQVCQPSVGKNQSSFIITGRGGLPPNPREPLSSDAVQVDWVTLNPKTENRSRPSVTKNPTPATPAQIVQATGWKRNAKGEVVLTADAPTATSHSSWQTPANCGTAESIK